MELIIYILTLLQVCFNGCSELSSVEKCSGYILRPAAYTFSKMFSDCVKLKSVPTDMFKNLLFNEDDLSNKNAEYCFYGMFFGCSSLTTAPIIPKLEFPATLTGVINGCVSAYLYWFKDCFNDMFYNCSSLKTLSANFTKWPVRYKFNDIGKIKTRKRFRRFRRFRR